MTVEELLLRLRERDISLSVRDDRLVLRGDDKSLDSPALLASLRENKQRLIEMIRTGQYAPDRRDALQVPPNRIPLDCERITPDMLPLVELTQHEIDGIAAGLPGGAANIQDIYPLAPLQEGIHFHHLLQREADPYLESTVLTFEDRGRLDAFLRALQAVIDRHDIFRTAIRWEALNEPVQVVLRRATLSAQEIPLDPRAGAAREQLLARIDPRRRPLDIRQAPLMRIHFAREGTGQRWVMVWLRHHLASDHMALEVAFREIQAHLQGCESQLPAPLPFRNFVAQTRLGVSREAHERYFRGLLGDVSEVTAPFGITDVQGDGTDIEEAELLIEPALAARLRRRARALGVSTATICHLAFARVLAQVSGREDVVFGTVLFGRMQGGEGADWMPGVFINTLPVRIAVDARPINERLHDVQVQLAQLLEHEHASLALAQRCSAVAAPAPLFTALLNYRHNRMKLSVDAVNAWEGIELVSNEERTNYPLILSINDLGELLSLSAQAVKRVGAMRICEYMQATLANLEQALEAAPAVALRSLQVLPEAQRRQILDEWNATEAAYASDRCMHGLFEDQVRRTPTAIAVVFEGRQLTYLELNASANRLANYLVDQGVGNGSLVGLCAERSLAMVVGILAILKAGAAYVPIDPNYPQERLKYLLEDAAPRLVLAQQSLAAGFAPSGIPVHTFEAVESLLSGLPDADPDRGAPRQPAYVIYTSGSTGRPKGVMVEHRSIVNRLQWFQALHPIGVADAVLQKTPFTFDISVWEFFWTLSTGARLVVARPGGHQDPEYLRALIDGHSVTVSHFVPSMLQAFLHDQVAGGCPSLRHVVCSGEELTFALQRQCLELLPHARLHNLYGPTEAAIEVTYWECTAGPGRERVPIGRPIWNTQMYVLDASMQPAGVGIPGEICIAGLPLARGYINKPALTAEKFVACPFGRPGSRMYRTGDLGRLLGDGSIEYLGRNDFQVKIRGHRIELGEIETRLGEHAAVSEAVVLAREEPAGKRLVAYYRRAKDQAPEVESLRSHLLGQLPEYMVPAAFVEIAEWPLTPNGKLDRKALPEPGDEAFLARTYEPPRGEVEQALSRIWSELLGIAQAGRKDNFFELGGDSLLAVRALERMRRLGLRSDMRTLFSAPTLADLALAVDRGDAVAPPIEPVDRGGPLLPSFAQQRLWFLAQFDGMSEAYHVPMGVRLRGRLDAPALQAALDRLVQRHETLRTTFYTRDGVLYQQVRPSAEGFALVLEDWRGCTDAAARLEARMTREFSAPFDLEQGPLIRGCLITLDEQDFALLLTMHHIAADGLSIPIFTRELAVLYQGHLRGEEVALGQLPIQYADYAAWQRRWLSGEGLSRQGAYWRQSLQGAPSLLQLPLDRMRPQKQDFDGADVPVVLDETLTRRLKDLGQQHGLTLFMTVLAGWALVLSKLSNQADVVIGTPSANRDRLEVEGLIGFFVNTLALRVDASPGLSLGEFLQRVRTVVLGAQAHAQLPFERVVELVQPVRSVQHTPIFQVMLAWLGLEGSALDLPEIQAQPLGGGGRSPAKFDLTLSLGENAGRITGSLNYATSLFERRTVQRLSAYLHDVLARMSAPGVRRVRDVDPLPAGERRRILEEWNATAAPYDRERRAHEFFEAQVLRTPHALALVCGPEQLTYQQLELRANLLARQLRSRGVKVGDLVGLCLERGAAMVVGMLAILKAGGAYVPLDPSYPAERLEYMVRDAAPRLLITQETIRAAGRFEGVATLCIEEAAKQEAEEFATLPPLTGLTARHLAYVIYTSGSTGRAKGVMVTHQNLVNLLSSMTREPGLDAADVLLAVTTPSFDIAALELLLPLCVGARVVVVPREVAADPELLHAALARHAVTVMQATPTTWGLLADLETTQRRSLQALRLKALCGGEALPPALARRLIDDLSVELWNLYGPTETTIWSATGQIDAAQGVHLGRPIANTRLYILDDNLKPVPIGVTGEIHIAGDGVARGYLNRPELSAQRFLADPHGGKPGERMYRTGDLGRYRSDGTVEYLGRNDFQVKIRGHRIELGEIEAKLGEHAGVADALVVARDDENGGKRLVAYYRRTGDEPVGAQSLRAHLQSQLPDYMVPGTFVQMEQWPLTPNGKIDRQALPAPDHCVDRRQGYEPPTGETEQTIAGIWSRVLGIDRLGRHDNFFDLGGHSLLAVSVAERLRKAGLRADVVALVMHPTIAGLARELDTDATRKAIDGVIPIRKTGSRRRLFLVHELGGQGNYFASLAAQIDPDIPVYGLPGIPLSEMQPATLAEFASQKLQAIRAIQAAGPYRLAGYSFGGMLAYEIARQLLQQGEQVEFVAILDHSLLSRADEQRSLPAMSQQRFFLTYLPERFYPGSPPELKVALERLTDECDSLGFDEVVRRCRALGCHSVARQSVDELRKFTARMLAHTRAALDYQVEPISVPVHILATRRDSAAADAYLGWDAAVPKEQLRLITVPGDHFSMMEPPHIHDVGRALSEALARHG